MNGVNHPGNENCSPEVGRRKSLEAKSEGPEMSAETKALLISIGSAEIDRALLPTGPGSSAGPGAGLRSIFFSSGGKRVRLFVESKGGPSPLSIVEEEGGRAAVKWKKDGKVLAHGRVEKAFAHCPKQAFVTISEKCIFDCKYCAVPKMQSRTKPEEEVLRTVEAVYKKGELEAISITSGIEKSAEDEALKVLRLLPSLQRYGVPIGVSVYPAEGCSERFLEAGAMEVKYNVETMDPEIFSQVCEGLSLTQVLEKLEEAVRLFGKNRVFTNFIIGLGETDECVEAGVEKLASMGVIPMLRPVNPHPLRKGECFMERPSPERLLKLARMEKRILSKYGLRPDLAKTMCSRCTGCDLVPFVDI